MSVTARPLQRVCYADAAGPLVMCTHVYAFNAGSVVDHGSPVDYVDTSAMLATTMMKIDTELTHQHTTIF